MSQIKEVNDRAERYTVITLVRDEEEYIVKSSRRSLSTWSIIMDITNYESYDFVDDDDAPKTMLWDFRFRTRDGRWKIAVQLPNGTLD